MGWRQNFLCEAQKRIPLLCNILGKISEASYLNIKKDYSYLRNLSTLPLSARSSFAMHQTWIKLSKWWIIKHMNWEMHHLADWSEAPALLLSDSHPEMTPSAYIPLFFSLPIALISGLWYSMNRERDPAGVDALMHPPVTLTLIPASVKLQQRLRVGPAWAILKRRRGTSG